MKGIEQLLEENQIGLAYERIEESVMGMTIALMLEEGTLNEEEVFPMIGPYLVEDDWETVDAPKEDSKASEEAKKKKLEHIGYGKYKDKKGNTWEWKDTKFIQTSKAEKKKKADGDHHGPAINKHLAKLGLTLHKDTPGLVDYVKNFTKGTGRVILSALKGDKEAVKKEASKLKKEDVVDFLLKLDMATMHMVTGPIHTIDAITGWDLWANVKKQAKKAESVVDAIKKAIKSLQQKIKSAIEKPKQEQMIKSLENLHNMVGADEKEPAPA